MHTEVPPAHLAQFSAYLRRRQASDDLLFPATADVPLPKRMPALLSAIRAADPELNLRAMRRGALQTMALAGVSAETLMTFSGHTNDKTLKRYLDWGRLFGAAETAGRAAARHLAGGTVRRC